MAFGKELKRLREASGLSAQQLADDLKLSAHKLRKWEERDIDPKPADRKRIEDAYKMTLEELVKLRKLPKVEIVELNMLNDPGQKYISKDEFINVLMERIKEQQQRLDMQERFIDYLEERVNNPESTIAPASTIYKKSSIKKTPKVKAS